MPCLKVLYLKGNPVTRKIPIYRKTLIHKISNLTFLDDKPIDEGEKLAIEAYFQNGLEAERRVREEYRKQRDTGYKIREQEKNEIKVPFEERKKKALQSLRTEYIARKTNLENKKRKLVREYEENPDNRQSLSMQLRSIDYQITENEKFKIKEEDNVMTAISKRENVDRFISFEYEDWMEPIFIMHTIENLFDFEIAVKMIRMELKTRGVQNWELFNELDLRSKWTDIEMKVFRKNDGEEYEYSTMLYNVEEYKNNNENNQNNENNENCGFKMNIEEEVIDESKLGGFVKEEVVDTSKQSKINYDDLD